MTYTAKNLIENRGKPLSVAPSTPVTVALNHMLENDYSQLPIINEDEYPIGMVTYHGITRKLYYENCKVEELLVKDIRENVPKTQIYRSDDNLFDMLDTLRDTNAILVVDATKKLIGIVTTYDATEYFRMRAEDMMHVEDIETTIKVLVKGAFSSSNGGIDVNRLQSAVDNITSGFKTAKEDYAKALNEYLQLCGSVSFNQPAMEKSYEAYLKTSTQKSSFEDLTLNDFIELLLHPDLNEYFTQIFGHPQERIRKLLQDVRDTRNDLAHFREINAIQRDQLRHCRDQFERVTNAMSEQLYVLPENLIIQKAETIHVKAKAVLERPIEYLAKSREISPTDEETLPSDSKYIHLVNALQDFSGDQDKVRFSFEELDEILPGGLPPSARNHRAWWANDSVGHVQSQLWLEAGWRTSYINMTQETVVFNRIQELEKQYIQFFNELASRLKETEFPIKDNLSLHGKSWLVVCQIPEDRPNAAAFSFAFSTRRRFRVEMYIDTGEREKNKAIFDKLHEQKHVIEESLDQKISWERINKKRASRIGIYHPGHISDEGAELEQLQEWASFQMTRFYRCIGPQALQVIKEVELEFD